MFLNILWQYNYCSEHFISVFLSVVLFCTIHCCSCSIYSQKYWSPTEVFFVLVIEKKIKYKTASSTKENYWKKTTTTTIFEPNDFRPDVGCCQRQYVCSWCIWFWHLNIHQQQCLQKRKKKLIKMRSQANTICTDNVCCVKRRVHQVDGHVIINTILSLFRLFLYKLFFSILWIIYLLVSFYCSTSQTNVKWIISLEFYDYILFWWNANSFCFFDRFFLRCMNWTQTVKRKEWILYSPDSIDCWPCFLK